MDFIYREDKEHFQNVKVLIVHLELLIFITKTIIANIIITTNLKLILAFHKCACCHGNDLVIVVDH